MTTSNEIRNELQKIAATLSQYVLEAEHKLNVAQRAASLFELEQRRQTFSPPANTTLAWNDGNWLPRKNGERGWERNPRTVNLGSPTPEGFGELLSEMEKTEDRILGWSKADHDHFFKSTLGALVHGARL